MRQLILKIPEGNSDKILQVVEENGGKNTINFQSEDGEIFILFLPNKNVDDFLKGIRAFKDAEINLIPRGIITLYPSDSDLPEKVKDVKPKSALEIYLGGIQSVGSKFGLISYSFVAGILVWIGFYTTTVSLLIAAMIIAPFAGPAMNAAIATAAGEWSLLKSSITRYAIAILSGIIASFLMTVAFPLEALTPLMVEVSQVSAVALFLPLISGFAGAVNICQSDRDSLVSGAAVGILVAASLAPAVGLVGVGIYIMDMEIILSSLFRIIQQLLGIHLAATVVFTFYGKIAPSGIRFINGRKTIQVITTAVVILALGGLMVWQFYEPPSLRKASLNTEFTEAMSKELKKLDYVKVIDVNATFSNKEMDGLSIVNFKTTLLPLDTTKNESVLRGRVIKHLKRNLNVDDKNIYKIFDIDFVED